MKKIYLILLCLIGIHLFLLVNLRFTAWPEMFSYPYLRNHGFLLYKDMIHPYPPLLTMILSYLYRFFGYKLEVLKIFTWSLILSSDVLIFLIVKKLSEKNSFAFLSLIFYILTEPFLEGNQLWFDLAIVPPILLAVYFLIQKQSSRNTIIVGFCLAVAALTKQTAGLFLIASSLYLAVKEKNFRKLFYLYIGPLILGIPLSIRLWQEGAFREFLNWVIVYPFTYWSKFPGYVQMNFPRKEIFILLAPLLVIIFVSRKLIFKDKNFLLLLLFLISSVFMVYPRFSFFHFQLALAFIVILLVYLLYRVKVHFLLLASYYLLLLLYIVRPSVARDWGRETRFWGKGDIGFADAISQNISINQPVYLLGPQSGLYVMANRLPPRPWTDNFGWYLEISGVQEGITARWQENPPIKIVWQEPKNGNWFDPGTYQPRKITNWIVNNYTKEKELEKGVWIWRRKS